MKVIIVDTNGFLRFILNDIPAQRAVIEKFLQEAKKSKIIIHIPQIVIFEIQFILDKYYHFDKVEIIKRLYSLVSANYLDVQSRNVFLSALPLYEKHSISFADSFLLATAEENDVELFTFDKKLKKLI